MCVSPVKGIMLNRQCPPRPWATVDLLQPRPLCLLQALLPPHRGSLHVCVRRGSENSSSHLGIAVRL